MTPADAAVALWARRVGPCAVFDRDDARQEAAIAAWHRPEDCAASIYRDILDRLRTLIPGFRQGAQLFVDTSDDDRRAYSVTPEAEASAIEMIERIGPIGSQDRTICEILLNGAGHRDIGAMFGRSDSWVAWRAAQIARRIGLRN